MNILITRGDKLMAENREIYCRNASKDKARKLIVFEPKIYQDRVLKEFI